MKTPKELFDAADIEQVRDALPKIAAGLTRSLVEGLDMMADEGFSFADMTPEVGGIYHHRDPETGKVTSAFQLTIVLSEISEEDAARYQSDDYKASAEAEV